MISCCFCGNELRPSMKGNICADLNPIFHIWKSLSNCGFYVPMKLSAIYFNYSTENRSVPCWFFELFQSFGIQMQNIQSGVKITLSNGRTIMITKFCRCWWIIQAGSGRQSFSNFQPKYMYITLQSGQMQITLQNQKLFLPTKDSHFMFFLFSFSSLSIITLWNKSAQSPVVGFLHLQASRFDCQRQSKF